MHDIVSRWAARPRRLARSLDTWWRERAMVAALGALDDAALKDIGVYRGEIPGLARRRWRASDGGGG